MLLKERENGREDEEEENVTSFFTTLRKEKDAGIALSGEVPLVGDRDLTVRQNT